MSARVLCRPGENPSVGGATPWPIQNRLGSGGIGYAGRWFGQAIADAGKTEPIYGEPLPTDCGGCWYQCSRSHSCGEHSENRNGLSQ